MKAPVKPVCHIRGRSPRSAPAGIRALRLASACCILLLVNACDSEQAVEPRLSTVPTPAASGASLPRLSMSPQGEVWLSWVEEASTPGTHRLLFSVLGADGWGPPVTVAEGGPWFVNWADFPSVVPLGEGRVAAHWLAKREGGVYAYDVAMAVSTDNGKSWGEPLNPHTDGTATEHGFATIFRVDDEVGIVWLDGRNMSPAVGDEGHHGHGGMTLRFGRIDFDGELSEQTELDDLTCDCCQTGATVSVDGPVVVYRDRTSDEIRDIYVTRLENGRWTAPSPVAVDNWHIAACPVNGPAIGAVDARVAVAWFTGADERSRVQMSVSTDGGATFGRPHLIDEGRVLGRVGLVMRGDGSTVVSWMAMTDDDTAALRFRLVSHNGATGPIRTVTMLSGARRSGVPQIALRGNQLVFAWTRADEADALSIGTAIVELPPISSRIASTP